jgi:glycosyltransferase involved in cell wall biosynthesis
MTYIKDTEPVGIILPTYNRVHRVGKAMESVLAQTYTDF